MYSFFDRLGDLSCLRLRPRSVLAGLIPVVLLASAFAAAPARPAQAIDQTPGAPGAADSRRFTWAAYQFARPTSAWGSWGSGPGEFNVPIDVATSGSDRVYVLDYGYANFVDGGPPYRGGRVQRFDRDGRFLGAWGEGQLDRPFALAVSADGDVWVADTFNHVLRRYSPDGALKATWGGYGSGLGQLDRPTDLAFDAAGNLYVVEFGNNRVQAFAADGTALRTWGRQGSGAGELRGPHGIEVDGRGRVYVADTNNHRIAKFTAAGALLAQWTSQPATDPACPPADPGELCRPRHLAVDLAGNILVADRNHHRIQVFSADGLPLAAIGGEGVDLGALQFPYAAAITDEGLLYVADTGNHRIQLFTLGAPLRLHLPFAPR